MNKRISKLLMLALGICVGTLPPPVWPDDIDLFVGAPAVTNNNPNILFVLDNTSNWSGNDQHFPDGKQGVAELQAIKTALAAVGTNLPNINVGIMEFPAGETGSSPHGGYIRSAIRPMTSSNFSTLSSLLDYMSNNITDSQHERQNSNLPYGNLMADAYNYFKGLVPIANSADVTNTGNADSAGYTTNYTRFKSPLSGSGCGHNFIIFIANPNSNGPNNDSSTNTSYLSSVGGSTTQLPHYLFASANVVTDLGYAAGCYSNNPAGSGASACTTAETTGTGAYVSQCAGYASCACSSTTSTTALSTCGSGTQRYSVFGTNVASSTPNPPSPVTCPASTTSGSSTTSWASCSAPLSGATTAACGANQHQFEIFGTKTVTNVDTGTMTSSCSVNPPNSVTCPAASGNVSWTSCQASTTITSTTGCSGSKKKYEIFGTKITTSADTGTVSSCTNDTVTSSSQDTLGNTLSCYSSAGSCSTSDYSSLTGNYNAGLSCGSPSTTTGSCPLGGVRYKVQGTNLGVSPTGTQGLFANKFLPLNANLWAQYMYQNSVASTFTVDVYNAAPSTVESELYYSMAKLGGGNYYAATNAAAIVSALTKILNQIQSVNSTFASAALPVNATNRAQNQNQVFIGMFRPDPQALPRWYGNLKQYQLIKVGTGIELGDALGASAVNLQTGFISDCAVSYWTNDSGTYWQNVPADSFGQGKCSPNTFSPWSDKPDGPLVEKGAAAEIQRQGNNPSASPTYQVNSNRNVLTLSGSSLVPFNSTNAPSLSSSLIRFVQGYDVKAELTTTSDGSTTTSTRPSMHGDVIHSRPLPLNYGTSNGVVAYYGSNDGTLRAVDASNGKELWAFVAPEFFSRMQRLMDNSPAVKFPNSLDATATAKDYFFDGSIGVYQNADNSKVWIYPTMHRGGRMIYGLDVTTPATPTFKWKVGCPNLTDNVGCTSDTPAMGQTWSLPNVAFIKGFSATTPVIIVGGGYDSCEDANSGTPSCGSPKGNVVYVLNADTGAVLKSFTTTRSVAADVSLVDLNSDGSVDYAYAADTGGNIYRISFVDAPGTLVSQAASGWTMTRVAYTSGAKRKFLFGPAVAPAKDGYVYLALGSGDREHPLISHYPYPGAIATGDPGVLNRFYVYVDNLSSTAVTNLDDTTLMANASGVGCDPNTMIYPVSSKKGWYLDLNQYGSGEQTVTSAVIAAGLVTFSTNRPTVPDANSCANLGEARGYLLDLFNGSGAIGVSGACGGQISNTFVGGGLPPSPVLATVPISGTSHTVLIGAVQKDGSTSTIIQSQQIDPTIGFTRKQVYWKKSGDN